MNRTDRITGEEIMGLAVSRETKTVLLREFMKYNNFEVGKYIMILPKQVKTDLEQFPGELPEWAYYDDKITDNVYFVLKPEFHST